MLVFKYVLTPRPRCQPYRALDYALLRVRPRPRKPVNFTKFMCMSCSPRLTRHGGSNL